MRSLIMYFPCETITLEIKKRLMRIEKIICAIFWYSKSDSSFFLSSRLNISFICRLSCVNATKLFLYLKDTKLKSNFEHFFSDFQASAIFHVIKWLLKTDTVPTCILFKFAKVVITSICKMSVKWVINTSAWWEKEKKG